MKFGYSKFFTAIIFVLSYFGVSCHPTPKVRYQIQNGDTIEYTYSGDFLAERKTIKYGMPNGLFEKYCDNEVICERGILVNGKKSGAWEFLDGHGRLTSVREYLDDSFLFTLDISDFILDTLHSDGIKLSYPQKWDIDTSAGVSLIVRKNCIEQFCANVTINIDTIYVGLGDYVEANVASLRNQRKIDGIYSNSAEIGNTQYFQFCYSFAVDNVNIIALTTWARCGERVCIVTGVCEVKNKVEFLKYKDVFDRIAKSVVFQ